MYDKDKATSLFTEMTSTSKELDPLMARLNARLKSRRGEQARLAKTLGVTTQSISRWINRKKDPGMTHYLAIKAFLDTKR